MSDINKERLSINQWAPEDRPREKLERLGAAALSNAELLAILIGSGSMDESAVSLMQRILNDCNNNLNTLGKMTIRELTSYKGVGPAKAITILAACELGKRRQMERAEERQRINSAADVYEQMLPVLQDKDTEEAWLLLLNQNFRLIKKERISSGGISQTAVDIRIIMREAIVNNATVIVLCHNHPSGSIKPSINDDHLTTAVNEACVVMHIHLLDHVIIADGNYYSYRDAGKI